MVIHTTIRNRKTAKYKKLKKQIKKFGVITSEEFEVTDDDFARQLWDDNERLEKEVKVLRNELNKSNFRAVIIMSISIIVYYLNNKFKQNKSE